MSQVICETEAVKADGHAKHGGLNQSVHSAQNKPIVRPAVHSAGVPVDHRTKNAIDFPAHGSIPGPALAPTSGLAHGPPNSHAYNRHRNGYTNSFTNDPVHGRVKGHRYTPRSRNKARYGTVNGSSYSRGNAPANSHLENFNAYTTTNQSSPVAPGGTALSRNCIEGKSQAQRHKMISARVDRTHGNENGHEQSLDEGLSNGDIANLEDLTDLEDLEENKESDKQYLAQFLPQVRDTYCIKNMGSFFTLDLESRDQLWTVMQMHMPKFEGYQSWALPFPAHLNFTELVIFGCNDSREHIDSRLVRIVFRTHFDKNGKEVSKDILLTPCSGFIDLEDLRVHGALMDAWWKLCRWLARLVAGEEVKLLDHLKHELELEVQQKHERTF
ncbi:hypothetical protein PG993_007915 [Apiospora rasikravindrae]|uniref:Uncharacterized protein n=1 Tax=Apiospora rasikravindrae TaxID=990691 RepID=A0ABR1SYU9_9PEZI